MNIRIKKLFALLLSVMILSSFSLICYAEEYTAYNGYSYDYMVPNLDAKMNSAHKFKYVYDFADLLTDDEEAELSSLAEKNSEEAGYEINFLTYDDAYGKSEVTFTDDFYDYYITRLDFYNEVDGVLIAIDMDNRQLYINTVGTAIDNISDYEIDQVLDNTYEYASDGEYFDFFTTTLDGVLYVYESDSGDVDIPAYQKTVPEKLVPTMESLVFSIFAAVAVIIGLSVAHNKNNKAPAGQTYLTNFNVVSRNAVFMGHREEVLHDFYKQQSSGGGGGGSSHSSGGGGSHGGGGHGF